MKKVNAKIIGVSAAAVLGVATLTPAIVTAWGDNLNGRQVYTLEQVEHGDLGDKITFNSITNGAIGDERNFVAAKVNSQVNDTSIPWEDTNIQLEDGQTYDIRLYVHNNSPLAEKAIATGVKARFSMPNGVGDKLTVTGYIEAPTASPTLYWDEVYFVGDGNYWLEYIEDSAIYHNNKGTFNLSNNTVAAPGSLIGYEKMDGNIPGCYQYDGEVHIKVKAHKSVTAYLDKKVRLKGTEEWSEAVTAKVGDEVEYAIRYQNLLEDQDVQDVVIRDILPTNVEYVAGSTILRNSNHQDGGKLQDGLTAQGVNIGDYAARAKAEVQFTGKVVDKTLACGQNQLVNWANVSNGGTVNAKDDASVIVQKQCDEPEPDNPTPDNPTPDNPTPDNPTPSNPSNPSKPSVETPSEIVSTGPAAIATGAVGAGSMVTAAGYYLASRKKLM